MPQLLENAIVRILDEERNIYGAGFLASDGIIVTCEHVLHPFTQGLTSGDRSGSREYWVEFVAKKGSFIKAFRIEGESDRLGDTQAEGSKPDLAVLRLQEPAPKGCCWALLANSPEWDQKIKAMGFPPRTPSGEWAEGKLQGHNIDGLFQIVCEPTGYQIIQGYSGTPVLNQENSKVLGIVVTAASDPKGRTAFMLPSHVIRDRLRNLGISTDESKFDSYKFDIFVSYRRKGPALRFVKNMLYPLLSEWLDSLMIERDPSIFVDDFSEEKPGLTYPTHLQQSLQQSRLLLAVLSPSYFRSPWCQVEWSSMRARMKFMKFDPAKLDSVVIYPLKFCDGRHYDDRIIDLKPLVKDLSNWSYTAPQFKTSDPYLEFEKEIKKICEELSDCIQSPPNLVTNWPISEPDKLERSERTFSEIPRM